MTACYTAQKVAAGIWHIWDPMGVGMTLLVGTQRALLFDTGYGLWDLKGFLQSFCPKPLTVLLSHAHPDHVLGALRLGECVSLHEADFPYLGRYSSQCMRQMNLDAARAKGLAPDSWACEHYLHAPMPGAVPLAAQRFDLGGLHVRVLPLPGHTPGSIGLLVEERELLLLADSWNPQTWLFFPECCPVERYRQSMRALTGLTYKQVLVSHDPFPRGEAALRGFIDGLTDQVLEGALPYRVPGHECFPTRCCEPVPQSPFIFDAAKWKPVRLKPHPGT